MVPLSSACIATLPSDAVALGVVRGAYGIKGWLRIAPYAADGEVLLQVRRWFVHAVQPTGRTNASYLVEVEQVKRHGALLVAKWSHCQTPEVADALKAAVVYVARADFPAPKLGEYYWADLIGAEIINRQGERLGVLQALHHNGAQDLLEVMGQEANVLIPWVERYIDEIDAQQRVIRVDWQTDW